MQLTGSQFTSETALLGNDLSTLPDFPAEIRAPAGSLPGVSGFQLHFADHDILTPGDVPEVPLTTLTLEALKDVEVTKREAERSKNMFALGLMSWLYHRPSDGTIAYLERKFASKPAIAEANLKAFKAGWAYGETSEDFVVSYEVGPAPMPPG